MNFALQPWQFLLMVLAGWVNRQQQQALEFQRAQIEVLLELLGERRLVLNDDQRCRLAVKAKVLGRKALQEIAKVVTPDTLLRWHKQLVAQKWDFSDRRNSVGRPRVRHEIVDWVVRLAQENPTWGYDRIQGALANLGYKISDTTVGNILKKHGIEPVPRRKRQTTWKVFLKAHWEVVASIDFTTIEVWSRGGLVTFYLLFVMEVTSRRVYFAGCTLNPREDWMKQIARNVTDSLDGFLCGKRYLVMDRDAKHCDAFRGILEQAGVHCLRLPPRSPNLSAHIERFMRSIKEESLDRMILFGETSLRNAVQEYLLHYHGERNHQGLDNRLIDPGEDVGRPSGEIACRERLGGMLRYYYREAA